MEFMKPVQEKWRNSAVHKSDVQALVAPRGDMILAFCFLGSECLTQRFNGPSDITPHPPKNWVFLYPKKEVFGQKMGNLAGLEMKNTHILLVN